MLKLEWVDWMIIIAVVGVLSYSVYTIYDHKEVAKPKQEPILIEDINFTKVEVTPNITVPKSPEAMSFDYALLSLNKSDFQAAFDDPKVKDLFTDQQNILVALIDKQNIDYFTIRLVKGSFVALETKLYPNTNLRIDTDASSFREFILAAKSSEYTKMYTLLPKVKFADQMIRQKARDLFGNP